MRRLSRKGVLRRLLVHALPMLAAVLLCCAGRACADPLLVVFVHGRYEDASGEDWVDDAPAWDGHVASFKVEGALGTRIYHGVSNGTHLFKRIRESYWWRARGRSLADTVEKRVGRANVLYVRYDSRDSWYYEPRSAPLIADEVRAWLLADPVRGAATRSIAWIAHSNGGILVRALMSDPQNADIIARTREVITLGTPHRGSEMADGGLDGGRVKAIMDALITADNALGGTARLVGQKASVFDMVSKALQPGLEQVRAEVSALAAQQGWKKGETAKQTRLAQAAYVAQAYERELSGRIDEQLTTTFMETTQMPGAPYQLLPAADLPVPFFWIRGNLYPMDFLRMAGSVFQAGSWDDNDLTYFMVSNAIVSPRLARRFPDHPQWHRSDGVVSVESAAALGLPLEGNASAASIPAHHSDLLFDRRVCALVDRHLVRLARE